MSIYTLKFYNAHVNERFANVFSWYISSKVTFVLVSTKLGVFIKGSFPQYSAITTSSFSISLYMCTFHKLHTVAVIIKIESSICFNRSRYLHTRDFSIVVTIGFGRQLFSTIMLQLEPSLSKQATKQTCVPESVLSKYHFFVLVIVTLDWLVLYQESNSSLFTRNFIVLSRDCSDLSAIQLD
jgi:hypothetical protein